MQTIDVDYLEDYAIEYLLSPGCNIYLHDLDTDRLSISVGGRPLPIGQHRLDDTTPLGFAMWRRHPAMLSRITPRGTRIRAITVWLTLEWFNQTFPTRLEALPAASREHLAVSRWQPSKRLGQLARALFEVGETNGSIARLRYEIFALDLVAEALATIRPPQLVLEKRSEVLPLNRARDLIEASLPQELPIGAIAKGSGVGVATLRRLFKSAHGVTISEYVRLRRLDIARAILEDGGSVAAAADAALYTSPANFSTAFSRRFGITPREARRG